MVPDSLIRLITTFEGLRLRSYRCPAGVWTIGYGSTGKDIGPGLTWTEEQAKDRMVSDAFFYLRVAGRYCPSLTGDKLAAVADFAYNLGASRLASSTLRRKINSENFESAAEEFDKWVYCGGIKLPGLILRRHAEKVLFLGDRGT